MRTLIDITITIFSQIVDIDAGSRINVEDGDFVGVHYALSANIGIIPYEDNRQLPCCELDYSDLSRIYNDDVRDGDLPVGETLYDPESEVYDEVRRLPALRAFITAGEICELTYFKFDKLDSVHIY